MKKLPILLPILILLPLFTSLAVNKADTVDYLISMNLKAMGGKRNMEKIKTVVRIRGSANMVTVARLNPYGSLIIQVDTITWKVRFSEGRNDNTAWEQVSHDSGRKIITGGPDSALWASAQNPTGHRVPLYRSRSAGHTIEYMGREKIESINYFKILVTLSRGQESFYYINPETFLIERNRSFRRHHAYEEKEKAIETVWKDFRKVNGVMVAFIEIEQDINTGERLSGGKPSVDITFNLPVDESDFTKEGNPDKWIAYLKDFLENRRVRK
jgi:hypothetical protein